MKKAYWFVLGAVWILGACSTDEINEGNQNSSTNVVVKEEKLPISKINSVDENYKVYSINGLEYSVPESWTENVSSEILKYYYPEDGILMTSYDEYKEAGTSITNEVTRRTFIDGVLNSFDSYEADSISESEITIYGTKAYQYDVNAIISSQEYKLTIVLLDYSNGITSFFMGTLIGSDNNYSKEFENILSSINFSDELVNTDPEIISDTQNNEETEISIGKLITIGDYGVTIQSIEKGTDYEGNDILVINYDFTNNSDSEQMASFATHFTAYQNGIEIDSSLFSDDIDLGVGQKKIKPGITITGVQVGVVLEDDSVVTIELKELLSFNKLIFTIEVDPNNF